MDQVIIFNHPLIQHKLSLLRDKTTCTKDFRELVNEIATLLCYEATRDLPLMDITIQTPMMTTTTKVIARQKITIVPILRAGLGMVEGILKLIPVAKVRHVGLYRDHESLQPVVYYNNMSEDMHQCDVIIVDPMLASGGSAIETVYMVKQHCPQSIRFLCLIAAPEGVVALTKVHPDVRIYCASVDQGLNAQSDILPGLGDAGDRIHGTK